ncbi:MAG: hypothetical protein AAFQ65_16085 [Myxococcota bacterium]
MQRVDQDGLVEAVSFHHRLLVVGQLDLGPELEFDPANAPGSLLAAKEKVPPRNCCVIYAQKWSANLSLGQGGSGCPWGGRSGSDARSG